MQSTSKGSLKQQKKAILASRILNEDLRIHSVLQSFDLKSNSAKKRHDYSRNKPPKLDPIIPQSRFASEQR